ncbi:MAG TPA: DUF488 domain-containing protein [Candidatus Binatia bacterium]
MVPVIYSIGHSNVAAEDFFALLSSAGVRTLVDVRAFPASRRHPHFGREALERAAAERDIAYHWLPALGGRRHGASAASPHVAWEVAAFRNYADYADTADFAAALRELERLARAAPTAFMCAEALWWQCHRRLIADHLVLAGWEVLHIAVGGRLTPHQLPDFARVVDGRILYDRGATPALPLGAAPARRRRR